MVMETPSPQSVGREFVRQYYTVLNQAPLHLHRFYNNNSSFLHGGLEGKETKPAYGQQEIHKRIMQLNFRDCHAKIRQVDSHTTLGDGVVVQVSGELSNAGQTMRRFMQTFVLAPQSPKQYYVHNDIFRYQDEVFDEDDESDARENLAGDLDADQSDQSLRDEVLMNRVNSMQDGTQSIYYQSPVATKMSNGTIHAEEQGAPIMPSAVAEPIESVVQAAAAVPAVTPTAPLVATPVTPTTTSAASPSPAPPMHDDGDADAKDDTVGGYGAKEPVEDEEESDQRHEMAASSIEEEPKTYANMVSRNAAANAMSGGVSGASAGGGSGFASRASSVPSVRPSPSSVAPSSGAPAPDKSGDGMQWSVQQSQRGFRSGRGGVRPSYGSNGDRMGGSGGRDRKSDENSSFGGSNSFGGGGFGGGGSGSSYLGGEGERRRSGLATYPDNQQVFVGNLPLEVTEEELRQHFSTYGPVVDIRINSKPGVKQGPGGTRVPNFGFVVFDDAASVQKVLSEKQVMFNDHRLNVEEKKQRQRGDVGSVGRPGASSRGDGAPMSGGPRPGFGSDRGRGGLSRGGGRGGGLGGPRGGGGLSGGRGGFTMSSAGARR